MTAQEIFDKVSKHLVRQGRRSERGTSKPGEIGDCLLRAKDGSKCSIGVLIPDDVYRPDMEGLLVAKLLTSGLLSPPIAEELKPHLALLQRLQMIHDCLDPVSWPRALRRVAMLDGLRIPSELYIALMNEEVEP